MFLFEILVQSKKIFYRGFQKPAVILLFVNDIFDGIKEVGAQKKGKYDRN